MSIKSSFIAGHVFPGVPLAILSAVLFGATAPLSKILLSTVEPQLLAGLLYLGAGIGLSIVVLLRGIVCLPGTEAPLRRTDVPLLAVIVLFGGILGPVLLMLGLSHTNAASGSLLLNLEALATMGIAWLLYKENVDRRLLLGALAILLGAAVLSWQGHGFSLDTGAVLIALACLAWGIDNNLTRKLSGSDPVQIALLKGLAAGTVNVAIALARGAALPDVSTAGAAALVGFLGVGASLVLFVLALRHLGTARTGAYFSLAPFIGALVAVMVLHESVTVQLLMAGALMAAGLWLHLTENHTHTHIHETLEHEHSHVHDDHHQHSHAGLAHDGPVSEPHTHWHKHEPMRHAHAHYPDLHHRHGHENSHEHGHD